MGNILISLVIIVSIIIQKFESNVTNEKIIGKVQKLHTTVKKHFKKISDSPINEISKKIVSNWLIGLFILLAIINYISVLLFGNKSESMLLNNYKILYTIIPFIIILSGYLSNKWDIFFLVILLTIISSIFLVLFFNSNYNPQISKTNELSKGLFILLLLISVFIIVLIFIIYQFLLKWLAILFHFLLKKFFQLCLFLNPEKPLKPFVVIVEIIFILFIPVFNLL